MGVVERSPWAATAAVGLLAVALLILSYAFRNSNGFWGFVGGIGWFGFVLCLFALIALTVLAVLRSRRSGRRGLL